MEIPITPEITAWIESNRAEMLKQPKEYQYYDPGFKQVIDVYDAAMDRQAIEQGIPVFKAINQHYRDMHTAACLNLDAEIMKSLGPGV